MNKKDFSPLDEYLRDMNRLQLEREIKRLRRVEFAWIFGALSLILALLAIFVLVGCGGGDLEPTTQTTVLPSPLKQAVPPKSGGVHHFKKED